MVIEGDVAHGRWIEELGTIHHDPWMRDQVCRHIKPGDWVIQGGANIGTLTRAMLDAGARVTAFEPNPDALECLRHNCPEANIRPFGLAHRQHTCQLHKQDNAGATYLSLNHNEPNTETVHCIALDDDRCHPSLLLLDVEGSEVRALRGAAQTIARCKPTIICEVNRGALERAGSSDGELFDLLDQYGYSIQVLQPDCRIGDPQYDILCLPR